ncbi:MAG TPA: asparagine synthase (glutamine-hydrolyzing) [Candidatus Limnocylindria bacterium]|nr:asparagine synthase (glutamine-hydrolyzing) [Candidatus Limnocylindria bacterium]
MCGIAGVLSLDGSRFDVTEAYLTRMRDSMAHRGPDGADLWVAPDRRAGLAFRRLAILDLSPAAMQPMANEDGTIRVVFNGEIYNHAELRAELQRIGGHCWKTDHSDTEMILHAFEQWGIDCIERFRGMFALAIWDGRARELWLVRDRVGIKPLYYSVHHGRFAFASEIKALLTDPEQPRAMNEQAFYHFLSFLTTPAPETLFAGIRKIPNGTWLRVREDGEIAERRYWDVLDHASELRERDEDVIAQRVLSELRTSVQLRKLSDVPVGVFLSGGIDSSTNAALFSDGERQPVKTFSIGYAGENASYPNEFVYARRMAELVGADHHELTLTVDDLIGFLPTMVRLQDEPIADPVCVPVYFVSKLARDNGVIVAQVGEGADELFYGYASWRSLYDLQRYDDVPVPRAAKRAFAAAIRAAGFSGRREYEYLRRANLGQPVFWGGAEAFTEVEKRRLLSPRLRKSLDGLTSWEAIAPIRKRFDDKAWQRGHLQWMSYLDLNFRLPELLLMRVDKMSMGVSLEGRVPFLDHRFVELAMSLPQELKFKDRTSKYILKKAVRGVIPDDLIDRRKQGFGVPVTEWFFDRLGTRARDELTSFCDRTDVLDKAEVLRYLDEGRGTEAWYLLNFALWWKEFLN